MTNGSGKVISLEEWKKKKLEERILKEWKKEQLEKSIIDFFYEGELNKQERNYKDLREEYSGIIKGMCEDYGIDYNNPDLSDVERALSSEEYYIGFF